MRAWIWLGAAALLSGCGIRHQEQGYAVSQQKIVQALRAKSSLKDVQKALGEPCGKALYGPNVFYYVHQDFVRRGPLPLRLKESHAWVLYFDQHDRLQSVDAYSREHVLTFTTDPARSPDTRAFHNRAWFGKFSPLATWSRPVKLHQDPA